MSVEHALAVPGDAELERLLRAAKVIAVVGLSNSPWRPSYGVARYLQGAGYRVVPVTPNASEVLGERAYPDLLAIPFEVDIVDLFRRSEYVAPHVAETIQKGARLIWMQLGVRDAAAARQAQQHGIPVVMDRCIAIEHRRLIGSR